MTFDISRTETFVPFLWILAKTATVISLFSLLSVDVLHWKIEKSTLSPLNLTSTATISTTGFTEGSDRVLSVMLLLLVLCERGMDVYISNRSGVAQKVTKKTLTGLNTNVVSDIFVSFYVVHSARTQDTRNSLCAETHYGHLLTSGLWFISGLSLFLMQTRLKRTMLYYDEDNARRHGSHTCVEDGRYGVRLILCYVGVVFLMALSLTSPCLHHVYSEMTYTEFCLRLILYSLNVCGRCYTPGVPGDSFVHEMPNIVFFGWLVLLPRACVYLSIIVCVVAFVPISCITNSRKNTSMTLPILATDVQYMTPVEPAFSKSVLFTDNSQPPTAENNAEFLAKLQNMEESMLHLQLPTTVGTSSKSTSFALKRKTATLF